MKELIKHFKQLCLAEEMKPSYEEQLGHHFDRWEQDDCENRGYDEGYSEGYIKAMESIINILTEMSKEEKQ